MAQYHDLDRSVLVARWSATFNTQRADEVELEAALSAFSGDDLSYLAECVAYMASSSTLSSSSLVPIPSDKCKEVPLRSALRSSPVASLVEATAKEIDKQRRFGALGRAISEEEFSKIRGAITVDGHVLYKHKHDGRDTCRIAAMGDRLSCKPTGETFASVVSDGAKYFALSAMQAHCKARGEELHISELVGNPSCYLWST